MSDNDVHTVVSERSWLGRLGGSLVGAVIGVVLVFASIALLVWNEGRAVAAIEALDAGARTVVPVPAGTVDPANRGRLVHVAGPVTVSGSLVDPVFHVGGAGLLRLGREVEMYQWREKEESRTETAVGGKETTTTTYRYVKEWSADAIESSGFKRPDGHANPPMTYDSLTWDARSARLGAFALDAGRVGRIDAFETLPLPASAETLPDGFRRAGEVFYRGASPEQPRVGDLRVRFRAVPVQPVSVVAVQAGDGFQAYRGADGYEIDLVRTGMHDADAMFRLAKADEALLTWILRAVGFFAMLLGVVLIAGPLAWLASVLPFLEGVVNAAALGLGLIVAVPLTLVTIALSWLAFRPLIGGGLLLAAAVLAYGIRRLVPASHQPPYRRGFGRDSAARRWS